MRPLSLRRGEQLQRDEVAEALTLHPVLLLGVWLAQHLPLPCFRGSHLAKGSPGQPPRVLLKVTLALCALRVSGMGCS